MTVLQLLEEALENEAAIQAAASLAADDHARAERLIAAATAARNSQVFLSLQNDFYA